MQLHTAGPGCKCWCLSHANNGIVSSSSQELEMVLCDVGAEWAGLRSCYHLVFALYWHEVGHFDRSFLGLQPGQIEFWCKPHHIISILCLDIFDDCTPRAAQQWQVEVLLSRWSALSYFLVSTWNWRYALPRFGCRTGSVHSPLWSMDDRPSRAYPPYLLLFDDFGYCTFSQFHCISMRGFCPACESCWHRSLLRNGASLPLESPKRVELANLATEAHQRGSGSKHHCFSFLWFPSDGEQCASCLKSESLPSIVIILALAHRPGISKLRKFQLLSLKLAQRLKAWRMKKDKV